MSSQPEDDRSDGYFGSVIDDSIDVTGGQTPEPLKTDETPSDDVTVTKTS